MKNFAYLCAGLAALSLAIAAPLNAQEEVLGGANKPLPEGLSAEQLADRFEFALQAGDARILPRTEDFRFVENGAELGYFDGMWRTLTALEGEEHFPELDYRFEFAQGDTVIRLVETNENTVSGVMAYRLKAVDGKIASIEILPVREEFGGNRGGTLTLLQPSLPVTMDGELVGAIDPVFSAQAEGISGDEIERNMSFYFARMDGEPYRVPFPEGCERYDNGVQVTNVAGGQILDPAHPEFRPYALGCGEQLASGFYSNFTLGEAQYYTDPARGLGIAFVRLDQAGTKLSFNAPGVGEVAYPGPRGPVQGDNGEQFDGRILTNMISPMSVNGVFLFKFQAGGGITRIESFYRAAPLGWTAMKGE